MRYLLLIAFLHLTSNCLAQLKPCYSDNYVGRGQTVDIPCDPSANVSACCPSGLICATNFYCHEIDGWNRMGSCTDPTGWDPACPLPLLQSWSSPFRICIMYKTSPISIIDNMDILEPGAVNYFDYNTNTTKCDDGTFCPDPNNQTCCFNHEGVREITFHNNATIPTVAAGYSTYYEAAGYTIPSLTSSLSGTKTISPQGTFSSTARTITSAESFGTQPLAAQATPTSTSGSKPAVARSTSLSPAGIAGITIALSVCAIVIGALLFLLRKSRKKRPVQTGLETSLEALRYEMSDHAARTEMDAVEGRVPIGKIELMGQEGSGIRAEMPS